LSESFVTIALLFFELLTL